MDVSLTYHSGYTGKFYRVTGVNVTYSGAGIDSEQDLSVVFSSSSDFNQLAKATPLTSGRVFQRKLDRVKVNIPNTPRRLVIMLKRNIVDKGNDKLSSR